MIEFLPTIMGRNNSPPKLIDVLTLNTQLLVPVTQQSKLPKTTFSGEDKQQRHEKQKV